MMNHFLINQFNLLPLKKGFVLLFVLALVGWFMLTTASAQGWWEYPNEELPPPKASKKVESPKPQTKPQPKPEAVVRTKKTMLASVKKTAQALPVLAIQSSQTKTVVPEKVIPGSDKLDASLQGMASWYGPGFAGKRTASGTIYDPNAMTAAHLLLPLGTVVEVEALDHGLTATLTITDRGPYAKERVLDVSAAAAKKLGLYLSGTAEVAITVIKWPKEFNAEVGLLPYWEYVIQVGSYKTQRQANQVQKALNNHSSLNEVSFQVEKTGKNRYAVVSNTHYSDKVAAQQSANQMLSIKGLPITSTWVRPLQ